MSGFTVSTIDLTRKDPATGELLTANVYSVPGVNNGQPISLGGLVMALCLARATELEQSIIRTMDTMETNTSKIERLTEIEEKLLAGEAIATDNGTLSKETVDKITGLGFTIADYDTVQDLYEELYSAWKDQMYGDADYATYDALLQQLYMLTPSDKLIDLLSDDRFLASLEIDIKDSDGKVKDTDALIVEIEAKLDSLNTFSQKTMIHLQSETNKRDQAYDMAANALKSIFTTISGIVNNL